MKKIAFTAFILSITTLSLLGQPRVWDIKNLDLAKTEKPAAIDQILKEASGLLSKTIPKIVSVSKFLPAFFIPD